MYNGDVKVAEHQAFNEACIDRGPGMYMLLLECYIDGNYVTTIQVCSPRRQHSSFSFLSALNAKEQISFRGIIKATEQVNCGRNPTSMLGCNSGCVTWVTLAFCCECGILHDNLFAIVS